MRCCPRATLVNIRFRPCRQCLLLNSIKYIIAFNKRRARGMSNELLPVKPQTQTTDQYDHLWGMPREAESFGSHSRLFSLILADM